MPTETYAEIVKFTWDVSDVEAKAQIMITKAGEVSRAIEAISSASTKMGADLAAGFNAGATAADNLITKLTTIIELQKRMGGSDATPTRNGGGGGGSGGSGGSGSAFTTGTDIGGYHITPSGAVQYSESGRFARRVDLPQEVADMSAQIEAEAVARAKARIIDKINPNGGSGLGAFNPFTQSFLGGPSEGRANLPTSGIDHTSAGQVAGGMVSPKLLPPSGGITYDLNSTLPANGSWMNPGNLSEKQLNASYDAWVAAGGGLGGSMSKAVDGGAPVNLDSFSARIESTLSPLAKLSTEADDLANAYLKTQNALAQIAITRSSSPSLTIPGVASGLSQEQYDAWNQSQMGRGAGSHFLPGNSFGQSLARDDSGRFISAEDWINAPVLGRGSEYQPPNTPYGIGAPLQSQAFAGNGFISYPSSFSPGWLGQGGGYGGLLPPPGSPPGWMPTPAGTGGLGGGGGSGMLFGPGMGGLGSGGGWGGYGGGLGGGGGSSYFGGGPYYNYRQAQGNVAQELFSAEQMYSTGNFGDFENIMQGPYNAARRQAQGAAARQSSYESTYDFNQLRPPSAGADKYYEQFYANAEVNSIGGKLAAAQFKGNESEIDRLGLAYETAKEKADALTKSTSSVARETNDFGDVIGRVFTRILIYTAIFEAFRVGAQIVRSFADEYLRLSDVQARVGFINGQGVGASQAQFADAAQYGVSPAQAAPGILTAAQLGSPESDRQAAGQMALVFGANQYDNAIKELTQTRERAASVGLVEYHNLDLLATMYKSIPGDFESYNEAIKQGIQLHGQFGTSAEAMSLAIAKTSFLTETGPEQTSTLFQSLLSKLQEPATQKRLKSFGIEAGTPEEMIRDINSQVQQLQGAGRGADIQKLMEAIQGGGIGGYSRVRQMTIAFDEIGKALDNVNPKLANWNDLVTSVSDSGVTKINMLKSSWDAFLLSLANTPQVASLAMAAINSLNAVRLNLDIMSIPGGAKESWNNLNSQQKQDALSQYTASTGKDAVKDTPIPVWQQEINLAAGLVGQRPFTGDVTNNPEFMTWFRNQGTSPTGGLIDHIIGGQGGYRGSGSGMPGKGQLGTGINSPGWGAEPTAFGGFETFPKGQNWDSFVSSVRKYETQIDKLPGYDLNQKQFQYYDESTGLFRSLLADSNAIRFATDEQRKLLAQAFTGTFNVPSGGRIPFAALLAGFGPEGSGGGGGGGGLVGSLVDERAKSSIDSMATAAQTMSAAALGILGYLAAHGANVPGSATSRGGQSVPTASESGIAGYIAAHGGRTTPGMPSIDALSNRHLDPNRMHEMGHDQLLYPRDNPFESGPIERPSHRIPMIQDMRSKVATGRVPSVPGREVASHTSRAGLSPIQLAVTNNIRVAIDGRQISYIQNRQNYRQFDSVRNSNGAPNSVVSM